MSNLNAYADECTDLNLTASSDAVARLRTATGTLLSSLRAAIEGWQTQRFIARLPDHLLQDSGFERDWDGTIRSLRHDA